jgi:hypothetical protein
MRELQVREQLHRQRMQLLGRQCRQRGIVELGEIVFAELHGRGRLTPDSLSRLKGLEVVSSHGALDLSASQLIFWVGSERLLRIGLRLGAGPVIVRPLRCYPRTARGGECFEMPLRCITTRLCPHW